MAGTFFSAASPVVDIDECYQYSDASLTRCYGATYDAVGNPQTLTDPEGTDTIEYDALNRLKKVTRTSAGQADVVDDYDYNALGALKLNAGVVLDTQRPKLSVGGTADAGVPATYGGQPVTLDANGRVTSLQGNTFGWNERNWLQRATVGAVTESYGHDGFGRVVARIQSTTSPPQDFYTYDAVGGMNIVGVRRWTGRNDSFARKLIDSVDNYFYDGVDHPLRLQHRTTPGSTTLQTVYFELDVAGNVRRLRGPAGVDLGGYRYTAFGKVYPADATTPAAQIDQPLRWKGRWVNALTGLYDMRARQWSAEIGAFLASDDMDYLDGNTTLWGWPDQNPHRWSDPGGHYAGVTPISIVATPATPWGAVAEAGLIGLAIGDLLAPILLDPYFDGLADRERVRIEQELAAINEDSERRQTAGRDVDYGFELAQKLTSLTEQEPIQDRERKEWAPSPGERSKDGSQVKRRSKIQIGSREIRPKNPRRIRRENITEKTATSPAERKGLRIYGSRGNAEVRLTLIRFARWLRGQIEFPVRLPVYLHSGWEHTTRDGDIVGASFFAPFDRNVEPYMRIATGDYPDLKKKRGRDNARAAFICSLAHEVVHYRQWMAGKPLSEVEARNESRRILARYNRDVARP